MVVFVDISGIPLLDFLQHWNKRNVWYTGVCKLIIVPGSILSNNFLCCTVM